jgi:pyruvate,orthophosphate dikinase
VDLGDLTAAAFGCAREDAAKFVPLYLRDSVYRSDPFSSLDERGVGELLKALERRVRRNNV